MPIIFAEHSDVLLAVNIHVNIYGTYTRSGFYTSIVMHLS